MPTHEQYIKNIKYYKNWYKNNRKKMLKYNRKKNQNIKKLVISYYSKGTIKCKRCGFNNIDELSIDHIHSNGNEHRKILNNKSGCNFYWWLIRNDFPNGYQVLCMNCNFIKKHSWRNRNGR